MKRMTNMVAGLLAGVVSIVFSGSALAQSGHFLERNTQCTDAGTQVVCTGKVSGLGGTTFQIVIQAQGTATIECTNAGGNVAPGQTKSITTLGDTGPQPTPRNGNYVFSLATAAPPAPAGSCPNPGWTGTVTDVAFTTATLQLFEDGVLVDTQTVTVQ